VQITLQKFVNAEGLLQELFPPTCRPGVAWVRARRVDGTIPSLKVGRFQFYDVAQVRAALAQRHGKITKGK